MNDRHELSRIRKQIAESAGAIAAELEAGRASSPFREKLLEQTQVDGTLPVRAAVIASNAEAMQAVLSDLVGHDYKVCKVVVPARLGFSEVFLQERGFLLDTGDGAREFEDVGSFLDALQQTHVLQSDERTGLEPLRLKLKGPAHLSGLCLLIPHSLDALARKPALLSTLADQADWVFLAGDERTQFDDAHRQTIQLVLDHVTGLQNVLVPSEAGQASLGPATEWWKGWKVVLSLGLVRQGTELLRSRLALLTAPGSELRQYLVESRLLRQLDTTLLLMEGEVQQAQRALANRLHLGNEGLLPDSGTTDLRKATETIRMRLADEGESLVRAAEREARAALAPDGEINRQLRTAAAELSAEDIVQAAGEAMIKLTLDEQVTQRLAALVTTLGRDRMTTDVRQVREGVECSVRDAETALEKATGLRHKLILELPDEEALWQTMATGSRPEIRYRGEMPRPTLASRFQAARQGIMGLMVVGTVGGGIATLTGGDASGGGDLRTILYAMMLPLLILGFLWTYVTFRKKERLTLEKEVEKLQDGVSNELRRAQQELLREQHTALSSAVQRALRAVQQQVEAALEKVLAMRQRDAEEQRRRVLEQQRSVERRVTRLRQFAQQIASLRSRQDEAQKLQGQWLAGWIDRFNKGQT